MFNRFMISDKVKIRKHDTRFSLWQILAVGLIFVGVGRYALIHSFAAASPLVTAEAEQMTLPAGASAVVGDTTASGSRAALMYSNGTASGSLVVPKLSTASSLTVRAKGSQCQGAPQMVIKVDNVTVRTVTVSPTVWTDYSIVKSLAAGTHTVSMEFNNDNYMPPTCDRNLYIDKTTFMGSTPDPITTGVLSTVEAEKMTLPAGASAGIGDTTASAGAAALIWSAGTASTPFTIAPSTTASGFTVRAKGSQCQGAPQMVIKVDNVVVQTATVSPTAWTDYSITKSIATGAHTLSLEFNNDNYMPPTCDRNLYMDKTTFMGKATTPVPTCPAGTIGTPPNCASTATCPTGTTGTPPNCITIPCPVGTTGTPPNCITPTPTTCPTGQVGTPPNCTTPTPPVQQGAVPLLSQVGPTSAATKTYTATTIAPGTYRDTNFTAYLTPTSAGTYTFINSTLAGFAGGSVGVKVILDHVRVNNGIWFDSGSHSGWEIRWSVIDGGGTQALRPHGPGSILVEDSWLLVHDTPLDSNIHTEAVQNLNDAGGIYNRVAFSVEPRWASWGTPITAILNLGNGPMTFTDCILGYYNGSTWSAGGGFYAVYPGSQSIWIRPIIYHGGSGYWFTDQPVPTGARLVSPTLL